MTYDVIIIGSGPGGLSFARALAQTGLRLALIERQSEASLADPAYDGREIALTHLSRKIMQDLGMWDRLPEGSVSYVRTAKVLNGQSPYALSFDYTESGQDTLGFMVSNNTIRKAAYESIAGFENIDLLCDQEVRTLGTDEKHGWVELSDGRKLEAGLIVAADSRFSATRRMMGIPCSMLDFGRSCIVCTMQAEQPHDDTAYECFHFERTLAVLPLNDNQVSVVITLPSEESASVLAMEEDAFNADIMKRCDGRFGEMKLTSELFPYPLVATLAKRFYANRFALISDAAVGMHPVTAHGFNLGLRGAHTLACEIEKTLKRGGDFTSVSVLLAYERTHRRAVLPLYHGTNMLVKLYTKETPLAKVTRHALLRLGNGLRPAKRLIMNQLTETKAAYS